MSALGQDRTSAANAIAEAFSRRRGKNG